MVMNTFNIKFSLFSLPFYTCWHLFHSPPLVISLKREERQSSLSSLRAALAEQDSHDGKGFTGERLCQLGFVIVCLRCWDFVSLHATVTNIHLFQFPRDLAPEAFRPPLSAALLFSSQQQYMPLTQASDLVKPPKWPTQRHHQGKGEYRDATSLQILAFLSQGLEKGPRPLHTTAAALSARCLGFSPWLYANSISSWNLNKTSSTKLLLSSKICWHNKFLGPSLSSPITAHLHRGQSPSRQL